MSIITTKYLPATDHNGSRIKATTSQEGKNFSKVLHYDHGLDSRENHIAAFKVLAYDLKWIGEYCIGSSKEGYVFVRIDGYNQVSVL